MSTISNIHSIVAFDSKSSKAYENQRLAKVIYKTSRTTGVKEKNSVCVSVPKLELTDEEALMFKPYLIQYLEGVQDSIIRAKYEEGKTSIHSSDISSHAMLDWLEEDSKGGRLTKEYITGWFNNSLADSLTVAIADKLGVSDTPSEMETKKIEQMVNVYRDKFASLAGGKTSFAVDIATKLQKALEFAEADDVLAARFNARLEKMKEQNSADLLGL